MFRRLQSFQRRSLVLGIIAAGFLYGPSAARADCAKPDTLYEWIDCRARAMISTRMNLKANAGQVSAPSSSSTSTSLVDQSTASDLFGAAMDLAGLATKSPGNNNSSFSGVASAYSLKAAIDHHDPLDPRFYTDNQGWREVWITLGVEYPDSESPVGTQPATLLGLKLLLLNKRDLSTKANQNKINRLFDPSGSFNVSMGAIDLSVEQYLYSNRTSGEGIPDSVCVDNTGGQPLAQLECDALKRTYFKDTYWKGSDVIASSVTRFLKDTDLKEIDHIIEERIGSLVNFVTQVNSTVNEIRKAPQLSSSFQSTLRPGTAHNAYRTELIFDYGLANRLNLTINGSFDYDDMRPTGVIQQGGRFALNVQYMIGRGFQLSGKDPWVLSLSSQGSWMTSTSPTYEAQTVLTIPIASGVDFPISFTYANRTALIKEADVKGKFGFTFDLAKLLNNLRTPAK